MTNHEIDNLLIKCRCCVNDKKGKTNFCRLRKALTKHDINGISMYDSLIVNGKCACWEERK